MELTQTRLKELLSYDPESGRFVWIKSNSPKMAAGRQAGSTGHTSGYVSIKIDGKMHKAHRLAFLYMTGAWPVSHVDHIDRDRANNRWANLRPATKAENNRNVAVRASNKLGVKGVCWHKPSNKYLAQARHDGRHVYLGIYKTVEAASEAYQAYAKQNQGEFYSVA